MIFLSVAFTKKKVVTKQSPIQPNYRIKEWEEHLEKWENGGKD